MNKLDSYNEIYDKLTFTDEQKTYIAMRAAKEAKSVRRKGCIGFKSLSKVAAVAACLVSILTVTAEAAGIQTPLSGIFAPIFGGTVAQTEVIDKIGLPIDACDTDNGVTICADAIIGDQNNACIVFTIRREDGTPLLPEGVTEKDLYFENLGNFDDICIVRSGGAHGTSRFMDLVPGDHEIQYIYTISTDEPLNKATCRVSFEDICCWNDSGDALEPVIEGKWKFQFTIDYEDSCILLGNGETFSQEDMVYTIQEIRLSPIAVQVSYEVDSEVTWTNEPSGRLPEEDRRQVERYMENIVIQLHKKDGTMIDMTNSGGSITPDNGKTYCVKGSVLPEVIPLEDLESITVGSLVFPISDSSIG